MSTRNVLDWLSDAARLSPDAVAFEQPGQSLTWSQAEKKARSVGSRLAALVPR